MKVVYIQSSTSPNGLQGSWFLSTQKYLKGQKGEALMVQKYRKAQLPAGWIMTGNSFSCAFHYRMFLLFGLQDMFSYLSTKKLIKRLKQFNPDIIHLHLINDFFLHLGLLTNYINKYNIKVVWTFHDSRVLTGKCPCPQYCGCNQWLTNCKSCRDKKTFLTNKKSILDLVSYVHKYRKKHIGRIKNLTIVAPSEWMKSIVSQSYLKNNKCIVINNGIDLNAFHYIPTNIKEQYKIPTNSKVLLTVSNPITDLKGKKYILKLIQELPDDNYFFILIGTQLKEMELLKGKKNVLTYPCINRDLLIQFYSGADLFVYPTLADNYPTVCLEAQACGCPVIAFDSEGTKETIDKLSGKIINRGDFEALKNGIITFNYDNARENAIKFTLQHSQEKCISNYLELYNSLITKSEFPPYNIK